ncbi:DUF2637 domain-containing protein [Streptomyces sp. NPDC060194]|uniref:DUF2637 domain-containing protein n=1 Tax=Streptomyces sp. NPDC060194 TaxID=3347069 RepID=UPI00366A5014
MTSWDRSAIVLLGAAGFAFSYDALRQIAIAIHARETLSYLFPLFVDGFIAYGVRAIVLLRHERFSARLYAWILFLAATGASLGANALHAVTLNHGPQAGRSALHLADGVVGALSTLAPLALAGSVHLYILMARTTEMSVRDGQDGGPGPVRERLSPRGGTHATEGTRPPGVAAALAVLASPSVRDTTVGLGERRPEKCEGESATLPSAWADGTFDGRDQADGPAPVPTDGVDATLSAADSDRKPVRTASGEERLPVPDDAVVPADRRTEDEWLTNLLLVARTASEKAGRISRDAVKEAVRAHQPIGNDRLGVLLAKLREEEALAADQPAPASRPTG